jgi:hypothetical protein
VTSNCLPETKSIKREAGSAAKTEGEQRVVAARSGVELIEIAPDHAVFTVRPHELAGMLARQGAPRVTRLCAGGAGMRGRWWRRILNHIPA